VNFSFVRASLGWPAVHDHLVFGGDRRSLVSWLIIKTPAGESIQAMDGYFLRPICRGGPCLGRLMWANIAEIKAEYGKITAKYTANETRITQLLSGRKVINPWGRFSPSR
jgi:hypothetical protein